MGGTTYSAGATVVMVNDATLYAMWELLPVTNTYTYTYTHGDTNDELVDWSSGTIATFSGLSAFTKLSTSVAYEVTRDNNWGGNAASIYLTIGGSTQLVLDKKQWTSDTWGGSSGTVELSDVDAINLTSASVSANGTVIGAGGSIKLTITITASN